MTPKVVLYDFEFAFMSGQTLFVTAEEGRDRIAIDDLRVLVQTKADPPVETVVHRGALAYMQTTRREIPAETEEEAVSRLVDGIATERPH